MRSHHHTRWPLLALVTSCILTVAADGSRDVRDSELRRTPPEPTSELPFGTADLRRPVNRRSTPPSDSSDAEFLEASELLKGRMNVPRDPSFPAPNATDTQIQVLELNILEAASMGYFRHTTTVSVIIAIGYTMVFIIGIVGNTFVVCIVCKSLRMRTVTNYFIANLALADILVLIFCLPATLISNLFIPYVLGLVLCKTVSYLQGAAVSASINTMVAVTMDRFLAICFPMDWHMSRRVARRVIACIWLFSLAIAFPWALYFNLVGYKVADNSTTHIAVCQEDWPSDTWANYYFVGANLIMLYLLPAVVITICHLGIWYKIERRSIPGDRPKGLKIELIMQKSKLKVIKMMMVVVLFFLVSWLPLYILYVRLKLFPNRDPWEDSLIANVMPLAQWLGASNSCINPILYTFFNRKYKRGFIDLLKFVFCCRPLTQDITNPSSSQSTNSRHPHNKHASHLNFPAGSGNKRKPGYGNQVPVRRHRNLVLPSETSGATSNGTIVRTTNGTSGGLVASDSRRLAGCSSPGLQSCRDETDAELAAGNSNQQLISAASVDPTGNCTCPQRQRHRHHCKRDHNHHHHHRRKHRNHRVRSRDSDRTDSPIGRLGGRGSGQSVSTCAQTHFSSNSSSRPVAGAEHSMRGVCARSQRSRILNTEGNKDQELDARVIDKSAHNQLDKIQSVPTVCCCRMDGASRSDITCTIATLPTNQTRARRTRRRLKFLNFASGGGKVQRGIGRSESNMDSYKWRPGSAAGFSQASTRSESGIATGETDCDNHTFSSGRQQQYSYSLRGRRAGDGDDLDFDHDTRQPADTMKRKARGFLLGRISSSVGRRSSMQKSSSSTTRDTESTDLTVPSASLQQHPSAAGGKRGSLNCYEISESSSRQSPASASCGNLTADQQPASGSLDDRDRASAEANEQMRARASGCLSRQQPEVSGTIADTRAEETSSSFMGETARSSFALAFGGHRDDDDEESDSARDEHDCDATCDCYLEDNEEYEQHQDVLSGATPDGPDDDDDDDDEDMLFGSRAPSRSSSRSSDDSPLVEGLAATGSSLVTVVIHKLDLVRAKERLRRRAKKSKSSVEAEAETKFSASTGSVCMRPDRTAGKDYDQSAASGAGDFFRRGPTKCSAYYVNRDLEPPRAPDPTPELELLSDDDHDGGTKDRDAPSGCSQQRRPTK